MKYIEYMSIKFLENIFRSWIDNTMNFCCKNMKYAKKLILYYRSSYIVCFFLAEIVIFYVISFSCDVLPTTAAAALYETVLFVLVLLNTVWWLLQYRNSQAAALSCSYVYIMMLCLLNKLHHLIFLIIDVLFSSYRYTINCMWLSMHFVLWETIHGFWWENITSCIFARLLVNVHSVCSAVILPLLFIFSISFLRNNECAMWKDKL